MIKQVEIPGHQRISGLVNEPESEPENAPENATENAPENICIQKTREEIRKTRGKANL